MKNSNAPLWDVRESFAPDLRGASLQVATRSSVKLESIRAFASDMLNKLCWIQRAELKTQLIQDILTAARWRTIDRQLGVVPEHARRDGFTLAKNPVAGLLVSDSIADAAD
jgi:hypothetical protein